MGKAGDWIKENWYVPLMVGGLVESVNHPDRMIAAAADGVAEVLKAAETVGRLTQPRGAVHRLTFEGTDAPDMELEI